MTGAGPMAEKSLQDTIRNNRGNYIAIVEGAIPGGLGGMYSAIGGRSAIARAREVLAGAALVIAAGSCASDGGWLAAAPNPTGAMGVNAAVPGLPRLVNLPGCPVNAVNLAATIVYYLTERKPPEVDSLRRPKFAYEHDGAR